MVISEVFCSCFLVLRVKWGYTLRFCMSHKGIILGINNIRFPVRYITKLVLRASQLGRFKMA